MVCVYRGLMERTDFTALGFQDGEKGAAGSQPTAAPKHAQPAP